MSSEEGNHAPFKRAVPPTYRKLAVAISLRYHRIFPNERDCSSEDQSTGRVIAIRLRDVFSRPFQSRRRNDGCDNATLPTSRRVLQSYMSVNNVLSSVAEAIPLVGTPMKGALEALYKVLDLVETRYQIKEDTEQLLRRMESLVRHLSLTGSPSASLVTLVSQLEATSRYLECLLQEKHLRYHAIAKSITECKSQINEYLQECMLYTVVEIQASMRVREVDIESITVMDPLGIKQVFPKPQRADIVLIAEWVLGRYGENPQLQSLLKGFVEKGSFEITIDNGSKAISVPPELLPHLRSDTKLVMSVVTYQSATPQQTTVPCPSCHKDIPIQVSEDSSVSERVFCPHCGRNVQADSLVQRKFESPYEEDPHNVSVFLRNIIVKLSMELSPHLMAPPPMERALAESDALRFLDEVREEFWGHPEVYNQFLDTMKAYKRESLDVPGVIERVSELFHGKPTLIQGFNLFCPKEHQIDVLPDPNPMA